MPEYRAAVSLRPDERRPHVEHAAGRQSLQRLKSSRIPKTLGLVVSDESGKPAIEQQPAERDNKRLET
jgi:hypothetical protein